MLRSIQKDTLPLYTILILLIAIQFRTMLKKTTLWITFVSFGRMDRTLVVASLMIALLITAKSWMTEREYCVPCSMFVFLLILKPTSYLVSICSLSCLCKTTVTEDVVFHSVEGLSPSNILSNLTIGSRPPAEGSTTFAGDGFQYHFDSWTVTTLYDASHW